MEEVEGIMGLKMTKSAIYKFQTVFLVVSNALIPSIPPVGNPSKVANMGLTTQRPRKAQLNFTNVL